MADPARPLQRLNMTVSASLIRFPARPQPDTAEMIHCAMMLREHHGDDALRSLFKALGATQAEPVPPENRLRFVEWCAVSQEGDLAA